MLIKELMEMSGQSFSTVKMIFKSNFNRRGINILFPTHVTKQATEGERGADVQDEHAIAALNKVLRLYDSNDARLMGVLEVVRRKNTRVEVVFKYPYDDTVVNIPCAIEPDREQKGRIKFVVKTIMVKPNFKPHSSHDIVIMLL